MSSTLAFDSVKHKSYFLPLNDSVKFSTVDCVGHIQNKIGYSINHVSICMTVQELNAVYHICEIERTQMLRKMAMSVQNP